MTITTPSLLFPAISLLLLAYTNRFVTLASVIRQLGQLDRSAADDMVRRQIVSLRSRLHVIRAMQVFGVLSFILCTLAMFCLFLGWALPGHLMFGASLIALVISLLFSLYEVQVSTGAITMEIERLNSARH